jgi:hypothetical protein
MQIWAKQSADIRAHCTILQEQKKRLQNGGKIPLQPPARADIMV